jgi:hypothetical protein
MCAFMEWAGRALPFLPFTFLVVINQITIIRNIVASSRNGCISWAILTT